MSELANFGAGRRLVGALNRRRERPWWCLRRILHKIRKSKCKIFAIANILHYVCIRERNNTMNNEGLKRIKEAGLKLTPQRRRVYEAMMQLRHATVDDIIALVQSKDREVTVSTIYRILDSFCSANILSFIYHPDTGKCYYDITVAEHHHLFDGTTVEDYADSELSQLIRDYLKQKNFTEEEIVKIQVQVTLKKHV